MISFSPIIHCDLSDRDVPITDSRIEWGYNGADTSVLTYLHICANEECFDWTRGPHTCGDIIFDNLILSNPEFIFKHIQELELQYPEYASEFQRISNMIFIQS